MTHAGPVTCVCVANHSPVVADPHIHHIVPLYVGGPDTPENVVNICPTSHAAVHLLLRAWERAGGEPSWEVRRRFGPYVRDLARRGWEGR